MRHIVALCALAAVACTPKLQPPTAKIDGATTAHVGVPIQLDGSGSLPGPHPETPLLPLSFKWGFTAVPPGSHSALNDTTLAKPSFTPDLAGDYVVQLVVADGVFASEAATLTVKATNDCRPSVAKVSAAPSQPSVGEAVALSFEPGTPCEAAAGQGVVVAWKWTVVSAPAGSRAEIGHAASPNASFVPDRRGDYELALEVTDALGLTSDAADPNAHVKVISQACGDNAPEVMEIASSPAQPNVQALVQLSATVTDADTLAPCSFKRTIGYGWAINALPAGSKAVLNDAHATNPSFTPDIPGDYVVALLVTDELGRSGPARNFVVHTTTCGSAVPSVVAMAPATAFSGQGIQLGVKVTDSDNPAGDGVNSQGSPDQTSPTPSGTDGGTPVADAGTPVADAGTPVADGGTPVADGGTPVADAGTPVADAGTPVADAGTPVADAGTPVADAGTPVADAGSGTPDAGTPASLCSVPLTFRYQWRLLAAPKGSRAALNDANLANPSLTTDMPGSYTLSVTATASTGKTSAPSFATITVSDCGSLPPVVALNVPPGAITGLPVKVAANVTDPNASCRVGTPFAYSWSLVSAPAGSRAQLSGTTAAGRSVEQTPSFTPDLAGGYTVALVVTDHAGLASDAQFATIAVSSCNAPLDAAIVAPSGAVTGAPVLLGATVADPNAPVASSGGSGGADGGTPDAGGVDAGTSAADAGTVAPAALCSVAVLPYSYQWTLVGLPAGSLAGINNASASAPSFVADRPGTFTVQLVVTDAAGNRSPAVTRDVVVAHCTAPVTAAIDAISGGAVGIPLALTATVTDPNEPSASNDCGAPTAPYGYTWSIAGLPTGSRVQLNNASSVSPSFTPDVQGTYTLALEVTDAAGNRSPTVVSTVSVSATCTAPLTAAINATPGPTGVALALTATVTDPNTPASGGSPCTAATAPYALRWSLVGLPTGSRASLNNPASAAPSFVPDIDGSYTVALVVTDAAGNSSPTATKDIVTTGRCTAPLVASINSVSGAAAGLPVALAASVTDPNTSSSGNGCVADTAPYAYSWSIVGLPTGSRATLNNPASSGPSFTPDVQGSYAIALNVTDAAGNRSPTVVSTIAVSASCNAPVTAVISAVAGAAAGVAVGLSATVTDPNTPAAGINSCTAATAPYAYAWALVGLPTGSKSTLNNVAGSAPSFTPDVTGIYTVALQLTDAAGNRSATVTQNVTVSSTCTAPVTASINTVAGAAAGIPVALAANVNDPNTGTGCPGTVPYSYSWSLVGLPTGSRATLNNSQSSGPSFTPDVASSSSSYAVSLVVTDAAGNRSATVTQTVSVSSTCTAPLTASIDAVAGATAGLPVAVTATVTDPNTPSGGNSCVAATTPYVYSWSLVGLPPGSRATLNNASSVSPSFVPDLTGPYTVAFQVTDAAGNKSATVTKDVVVAATSSCIAPLTASINAPAGASTASSIQLTATVTDPNTGTGCPATLPYSYAWALVGLPNGSKAAFNRATAAAPSFTADLFGGYSVSLTVTDAAGNKSPAVTKDVPVVNCAAPLTVSVAQTGTTSTLQTMTFTATVTNPNTSAACGTTTPNTVSWSLIGRPARSSVGLSPNGLVSTLVADMAGTYAVAVRVTDVLGNVGTTTTNVPVNNCGAAPVATVRASAATPELGQRVDLAATVADTNYAPCGAPTAAPFSYAWTLTVPAGSAGSAATLQNAQWAQPSFTPDVGGTYTYAVTITDSLGYQATASGSVTAVACPLASIAPASPTITVSALPQVPVFKPVQLTGAVTFPGTCTSPPAVSYQWQFDSVPVGSNAYFQITNLQSAVFTPDVSGSWIVRLTVYDQRSGASASTTATVASAAGCGVTMPTARISVTAPAAGLAAYVAAYGASVSSNPTPTTPPNVILTLATTPDIQLDATQSLDPNISATCLAGPLTFQWMLFQVPPGSGATLWTDMGKPTLGFDIKGEYVVRLIVNDGKYTSAPSYLHFVLN